MARTSKAQQELEILRDHFDANVAKAVADATAVATARIAELEAKLDIAREKYVEMRDIIRELRAARPVSRPMTDAQRSYAQRAAEGRAQHAAAVTATRERVAAFWEAHKDAGLKSATTAQINEWYEQPAPVDCE
jgi:hypothetical protein